MKDYARNNFRQFNQEESSKTKQKKNKTSSSNKKKSILIYAVAIIIAIIVILSLLSIFSSKSSDKNQMVDNLTPIEAPKTPEIFNIPTTNMESVKTESVTTDEIIGNTDDVQEDTVKVAEQASLNSEDMQQIANEKLSTNEIIATNETVTEEDNSPKFTFYNGLSNQEVESDAVAKKSKKYIYTYMLQVGSYKDKEAVDAIRARLLLIGLKPEVSKHGSWYRIDVGPVYSKREGDILKHKLEAAKISGSMLRQVSKTEVVETSDETPSEDKTN